MIWYLGREEALTSQFIHTVWQICGEEEMTLLCIAALVVCFHFNHVETEALAVIVVISVKFLLKKPA